MSLDVWGGGRDDESLIVVVVFRSDVELIVSAMLSDCRWVRIGSMM